MHLPPEGLPANAHDVLTVVHGTSLLGVWCMLQHGACDFTGTSNLFGSIFIPLGSPPSLFPTVSPFRWIFSLNFSRTPDAPCLPRFPPHESGDAMVQQMTEQLAAMHAAAQQTAVGRGMPPTDSHHAYPFLCHVRLLTPSPVFWSVGAPAPVPMICFLPHHPWPSVRMARRLAQQMLCSHPHAPLCPLVSMQRQLPRP